MIAGCGGNSITPGKMPMTAIAPSEPINYPVGPGKGNPPSAKDILRDKVPPRK